jgi:diguanylate cyclase (GGDEF)-like protein
MYAVIYIIDIVALLYLIWLLNISTTINSYRKKPFLIGIILTVIIILTQVGTFFTENASVSLRGINIICNVLGFALTPIIPVVITFIINKTLYRKHKILLIPTLINIAAALLSPLLKIIFYVDVNNRYFRGDYYFIFIAVYFINFVLLVISTLDIGKKYNYPIARKMVALSLFTIAGTSIQLVYPFIYSTWHCVTLALFLYFLLMSEFDSSFDTLTGLYNRAAFDNATKQFIRPKKFSVIVLDINDFKSINDTYGHDYGDKIIKTVAEIIKKSFNRRYTCYRLGGDEFSIISNETDQKRIEFQLRKMTNSLAKMREEYNMLPTVSYGYSIYREREKLDFNKVLKEADDQMYKYKKVHKAEAESKISLPVS